MHRELRSFPWDFVIRAVDAAKRLDGGALTGLRRPLDDRSLPGCPQKLDSYAFALVAVGMRDFSQFKVDFRRVTFNDRYRRGRKLPRL